MFNRNQNTLSLVVQSPIEPKSRNVLWDDGTNIKIWRKSGWKNIGGGGSNIDNLYSLTIALDSDNINEYNPGTSGYYLDLKDYVNTVKYPWITWTSYNTIDKTLVLDCNLVVTGDTSSGGSGQESPTQGKSYLKDLLDVKVDNVSYDDLLRYDGTNWVPISQNSIGLNTTDLKNYLDNNNYVHNLITLKKALGGYDPIHSGNIGNQSVNYATSSGTSIACTGNANTATSLQQQSLAVTNDNYLNYNLNNINSTSNIASFFNSVNVANLSDENRATLNLPFNTNGGSLLTWGNSSCTIQLFGGYRSDVYNKGNSVEDNISKRTGLYYRKNCDTYSYLSENGAQGWQDWKEIMVIDSDGNYCATRTKDLSGINKLTINDLLTANGGANITGTVIIDGNLIVKGDTSSGGSGQSTPSGSGSKVSYNASQSTGTLIGTLTIDNVSHPLYVGTNLGKLAGKDSLTWSDVGVTDTLIKTLIGNTTYAPYNVNGYLPKNGGNISGDLKINGTTTLQTVKIWNKTDGFVATVKIDGSSLVIDKELKLTNGGEVDISTGIAAAFKTDIAQIKTLFANNVYIGASNQGTASNLSFNIKTYKNISNQAPVEDKTLLTVNTNGNISILGSITANTFIGSLNGNADTATALTTKDIGSSTNPIYWDNSGKPSPCGNSLNVSITGNAASATILSAYSGVSDFNTVKSNVKGAVVGYINGKPNSPSISFDSSNGVGSFLIWGNGNNTQAQFFAGNRLENHQNYPGGLYFRKWWITDGSTYTDGYWDAWKEILMVDSNGKICTSRKDSQDISGIRNLIVNGDTSSGSDIRYKNIIEHINLDLDVIANAPIFTFKWTDRNDSSTHLGTSAQYWEQYRKELITGDDFKHLNYASLGVAIGKSLAVEIRKLKDKIKELEEKLNK